MASDYDEDYDEDYDGPTEEELDRAREAALDWTYQEVFDEHGNSYRPWSK